MIVKFKIFIFIVLFFTTMVNASSVESKAFICECVVNLRNSPSTKGDIIMQLPYGTPLRIIEEDGEWLKVKLANNPEYEGYLYKSLLQNDSLTLTDNDKKRMKVLLVELDTSSFADSYIHFDDAAPEPRIFYINDNNYESNVFLKKIQEGLERLIYWKNKDISIKHYLWNIDILAERMQEKYGNVYKKTPLDVLNNSIPYQIPCNIYMKDFKEGSGRKISLPSIKQSIFTELPDKLLIKSGKAKDNQIKLMDFNSVTFIHLLRAYFPERNPFKLCRENNFLVYSCKDRIPFLISDSTGSELTSNSGRIVYYPGDWEQLGLFIVDLEKELSEGDYLLYFDKSEKIEALSEYKNVVIKERRRKIKEIDYTDFRVKEFDFNNDEIVDLIISYEDCPEEAGDSWDMVYYFNVNGVWHSLLKMRSWCNP